MIPVLFYKSKCQVHLWQNMIFLAAIYNRGVFFVQIPLIHQPLFYIIFGPPVCRFLQYEVSNVIISTSINFSKFCWSSWKEWASIQWLFCSVVFRLVLQRHLTFLVVILVRWLISYLWKFPHTNVHLVHNLLCPYFCKSGYKIHLSV